MALLLSASLQGLYGLLVLVSGHRQDLAPAQAALPRLGHRDLRQPEPFRLLPGHVAGRAELRSDPGQPAPTTPPARLETDSVRWLSGDGSRNLLLGLLLLLGLAGLLASFSRAGIALGLFGSRSRSVLRRSLATG